MLPATARRVRTAVAASIVALLGAGAVVLPVTAAHAVAPFPIEDPFADVPVGTTMPAGWSRIASGAAQAAIVDDGAAGKWLRLTDNANRVSGAVYNSVPYEAEKGLSVEFDMRMYNSTDGGYGDGMSFFLQDAAVPLDRIGPNGGGLGYYTDGSSPDPGCTNGLPGGVVGLGFDRYGNYQQTQTPNSITVRGSSGDCYPVLSSTGNEGDGYLESRGASSADAPYRHVKLDIVPTDDAKVRVLVGMSPFTALGSSPARIDEVIDTELNTASLPDRMRIGWAASTGAAAEYHEIRGITAQQPVDLHTSASVVGASSDLLPGDEVRIEAGTRNAGPADIGGPQDAFARTAADLSDLGLEDISWSCSAVGGATCVTTSGTGEHLAADWTGPSGSGIDIVVTGRVRAGQAAGTTSAEFVAVTDFGTDTLDPAVRAVAKDRSVSDTDLTNNGAAVSLGVVLEQPTATDDTATTAQGVAVEVDVAANDTVDRTGTDPTTVVLTDAGLSGAELADDGKRLVVPGQGTYGVATHGIVTFTPLDTFIGQASPVTYRVSSHGGQTATATLTVTVQAGQVAAQDDSATTGQGVATTLDVLANDTADASGFDDDSLRLRAIDGGMLSADRRRLEVAGEGTWSVLDGGTVQFTPDVRFIGTTAAVRYQVATNAGQVVSAHVQVTITAAPVAAADDALATVQDEPGSVDVLANDTADPSGFDPSTLRFTAPADDRGGVRSEDDTELVVDGQGTWTIDGSEVRFAPLATFIGSATPVGYSAATSAGQAVSASVSASVQAAPVAATDDAATTMQGEPVRVDVLANDEADPSGFDRGTLAFETPGTGAGQVGEPDDGSDDSRTTELETEAGSYSIVDGVVEFRPTSRFTGTTPEVRYSVATFAGQSVTAGLVVDVHPVGPRVADDTATTPFGQSITVDVTANDRPGIEGGSPIETKTLVLLDDRGVETRRVDTADGVYVVTDGGVSFTPADGFSGTAQPVSYRVSDSAGAPGTAHLTVTVEAEVLAFTGTVLVPLVVVAVGALVLGGIALVVQRIRRRSV